MPSLDNDTQVCTKRHEIASFFLICYHLICGRLAGVRDLPGVRDLRPASLAAVFETCEQGMKHLEENYSVDLH